MNIWDASATPSEIKRQWYVMYVLTIRLSSMSTRCGALHPGDQLLAFDDHVIDGNNYTAEEVMCYLENCEGGFTRLHVAPRHVIIHGGGRFTRG
jgi:hypothetical protein